MIPSNRVSTHPGEVLKLEFLEPLEQSQSGLARHLGIPVQRVNELIRGKRGVTPETAWLLSQAFDTSPEFWMNLQNSYDLSSRRPKTKVKPILHNRVAKGI
ncbi:MAG: HigA family addiction module antidote protein [Pseudomonadales bacterium]|nr:HigA family addiction module antidote protein [Pseudomonadales bacterium]